jgi:hypothetical protein
VGARRALQPAQYCLKCCGYVQNLLSMLWAAIHYSASDSARTCLQIAIVAEAEKEEQARARFEQQQQLDHLTIAQHHYRCEPFGPDALCVAVASGGRLLCEIVAIDLCCF